MKASSSKEQDMATAFIFTKMGNLPMKANSSMVVEVELGSYHR